MKSRLSLIDTAALREERIKEFHRLLMASCQAFNKLRSAKDAFELGEGSKTNVDRARRAFRKIQKAFEAAEIAAYGLEETLRSRAKVEAIIAETKEVEAAWRASPQFQKQCRDYENMKKHGARRTQHAGFTIIDGNDGCVPQEPRGSAT
jgi:hypothetical protein